MLIGISAVKLIDGEQIIVEIYGRAKRREEKRRDEKRREEKRERKRRRNSHSFMYQVKADTCTCDWLAQHGSKNTSSSPEYRGREWVKWGQRFIQLTSSSSFFF